MAGLTQAAMGKKGKRRMKKSDAAEERMEGKSDSPAEDRAEKKGTYAGAKPGSGKNFAALKADLSKKKGVRNPGALAAFIGRKKYGAKRMASMARKG